MGIPLGKPSNPPSIKFRQAGSFVDMAVADITVLPWRDFATGLVKKSDDGEERTQDCVTGIVIGGDAVTGADGTDARVVAGAVVSLFVAGGRRWDFVQAQKTHGGLEVGDVMRVTYTGDEQGKGASPKKVWSFKLRRPRSDEFPQTQRCEQVHAGAATALATGGHDDDYADEEPF